MVADTGPGSKLSAVIFDHKTVLDPRFDLAEPYTVYVIRVTTHDAHGTPMHSWQVRRRYQYFRNLFNMLKELQPKLRVECPKQHALRRVFGGGTYVDHRVHERLSCC